MTVRQFAIASIFIAIFVMALKFVAWRLTGSVALYSDALESIVNVVAAAAAFIAIRYAERPADSGHPFGHHKAEYFSAVLEGVLIVIAAGLVLREALSSLWSGVHVLTEPGTGMAVNMVATIINGGFAMLMLRKGRQAESPALLADGRHIMADVITSVGVLVGLVLALATGMLWLDPVLAILVALNIVREGWNVISESVDGLMDKAAPAEKGGRIEAVILANAEGASEVHDIRTRVAASQTFIEFHLVVDGAMTVEESHRICDRIEAALKAEIAGAQPVIHVEPNHKAKAEGLTIGQNSL